MTFASVALIRRRSGPANEVSTYRPMWEGTVTQSGWLTAVVQAQALNGSSPSAGWVRARNVTTGSIGPDVEVATTTGVAVQLALPELAVAARDLIEIQARPGTAGHQVYVEQAAATVSSVPLTVPPDAAVPAVFGTITVTPSALPPVVGSTFALAIAITAGSCDLAGEMLVEVEWKTPDGSNPLAGSAVGDGWYRGLPQTINATPATVTWSDPALTAAVAGNHQFRFAATNSTGITLAGETALTVVGGGPTVRGTPFISDSDTLMSIPSSNLPGLQPGDQVLVVMAAPGPSEFAGQSWLYPNTVTQVLTPGDPLSGQAYQPKVRILVLPYTGAVSWTFGGNHPVRVALIPLADAGGFTIGSPVVGTTPVNPPGAANPDTSLGIALTVLNFTDGHVTAPPTGHTEIANNGPEVRSIEIATKTLATAGTYDPAAATVGPSSEDGTAVAIVVQGISSVSAVHGYGWEDRPAYVEPNPTAAVGTPGRTVATQLGLTSRMNVATIAQFTTATTTATPGTQVYVTANLVGLGQSTTLNWIGSHAPHGGAGSAVDGTPANPILITCAPGVWLDGGIATGVEDTNSRVLQIRGAKHVGLYGANVRRGNFGVKFDQCAGTATAPILIRYCRITETSHSALHLGGYFAPDGSSLCGETNYVDVRYNEIDHTGQAKNLYGEGLYIGYGSGPFYTTSQCHDITAEANWFHHLTAESCDAKPGGFNIFFRYNLISDCGDSQARSGDNANQGYPGAVHMFPADDASWPGGYASMPGGYACNSEVIGNRFVRCSSAAQKYPDAQVILAHRGIKCIGNTFQGCTVPGTTAQIRRYIEDGQSFGPSGTFQIHNNTSTDPKTLSDIRIAGGTNAPELSAGTSATTASNNVGTSAQTGVTAQVTAAAFTSDGTAREGAGLAVATGGALDTTGTDTSALWSNDYAGTPVAAPVYPGARQVAKAPATTTSGEFTVNGSRIKDPAGANWWGAGMNVAANPTMDSGQPTPYVFEGLPGSGSYDIWPGATNNGVFPGGGVASGVVYSPEGGGPTLLPDRAYAMNGTVSAAATAAGISAPADNWKQKILRVTAQPRSGDGAFTPAISTSKYMAKVQELINLGFVVMADIHNMTGGDIQVSSNFVANPSIGSASISAVSARTGSGAPFADLASATVALRDAVDWIDAQVTTFGTSGAGGSTNKAKGYVWIELPNEPFTTARTGAYDDFVVAMVRRIRAAGAHNIIDIPLPQFCQGLGLIANGDMDSLRTRLQAAGVDWNLVWSWHAYGADSGSGSSGGYVGSGGYTRMNTHLAATQNGSPAGHKWAMVIGEYGEATPVGWGNAGPDNWNREAVTCLVTTTYGQALADKYPVVPIAWHACGDQVFWKLYKLCYGPGGTSAETNGQGTPFWDIVSGSDTKLTRFGAAHWAIGHTLFTRTT